MFVVQVVSEVVVEKQLVVLALTAQRSLLPPGHTLLLLLASGAWTRLKRGPFSIFIKD